jgi:hypothetical protein
VTLESPAHDAAAATRLAAVLVIAGFALQPLALLAQGKPAFSINEDCQAFAVSSDNKIAFAVQRMKRVKKIVLELDDIWVSSPDGHARKILEGEKFMPPTQLTSYQVMSLAWSPDGRRLTVDLQTSAIKSKDPDALPEGGRGVLLLDQDGREISIAGNKPPLPDPKASAQPAKPAGFSSSDDASSASNSSDPTNPALRPSMIPNATAGHWLADSSTVVYVEGTGSQQIGYLRPSDGNKGVLFDGRSFDAIAWDTPRNQAYAIGTGLTSPHTLMQLDLVHQKLRDIARLSDYAGSLTVAPSGNKVGYFIDGDTLEVVDVAHPDRRTDVRVGMGTFQWSKDERRILLKRGPEKRSNILVWVTLPDGDFHTMLHDLTFSGFQIAPDGNSIAVTLPGKRILNVYRLE